MRDNIFENEIMDYAKSMIEKYDFEKSGVESDSPSIETFTNCIEFNWTLKIQDSIYFIVFPLYLNEEKWCTVDNAKKWIEEDISNFISSRKLADLSVLDYSERYLLITLRVYYRFLLSKGFFVSGLSMNTRDGDYIKFKAASNKMDITIIYNPGFAINIEIHKTFKNKLIELVKEHSSYDTRTDEGLYQSLLYYKPFIEKYIDEYIKK